MIIQEEFENAIKKAARMAAQEGAEPKNAEEILIKVTNEAYSRLEKHMKADSPMDMGAVLELAYILEYIKVLVENT